jgi:hypothetical protein
MLGDGIALKVQTILEPSNRAAMVAQMAAISVAYSALHGTPFAPFLLVADVGLAASVGSQTALALFQIYLAVNGTTTEAELNQAARSISNQLTGRVVDAMLSLLAKGAKLGAATPGKTLGVHLNGNSARSKFGIYEIKIKGSVLNGKVGKADMNRVTLESMLPTRLHQQLRKLREKYGKKNVTGKIVQPLGNTTTEKAKAAENAWLQRIFDLTGMVPKGNRKSFTPEQ